MPTVHLVFSLRHPDLFDWKQDLDFSPEAHERLLAAHARVHEPSVPIDLRPDIEAELLGLRAQPMSQRQRMLLYYLLAECARTHDLTVTRHFYRA